ncbi:DUF1648 domain-containing protein [Planococcus sp. YIM B11945]|uniref:DUF1648 domain-containing protein n=1 Tax=Planococcus sp. YIM B11945 TaxID=3435410 RepID=UPI003D7CF060
MTVMLMASILIVLFVVQAFVPYWVKRTEVFGIYVPEAFIKEPMLVQLKKRYRAVVLLTGGVLAVLYVSIFSAESFTEEAAVLWGVAAQFGLIVLSMGLYVVNHLKVKKEKRQQGWTAGKREKVVVDLQFRNEVEMVSGSAFLVPLIVTAGLIAYTLMEYANLPAQIPTHFGPNGEPDAFTGKTIFSSISMLIMLGVMQLMFYFLNHAMKTSGSKILASQKQRSKTRQLVSRKYGSWLLFLTSLAATLLLGSIQLSIIQPEFSSTLWNMAITFGFLIVVLGATGVYTFKVAATNSVEETEEVEADVIDADNDRYWKWGIFYINAADPSVMVEKRFGIGWTINLGNPRSWLIVVLPLVVILAIAFLIS